MAKTTVRPLDLDFQGTPQTIASFMIPHPGGVVLVESGPGSTVGTLVKRLGEEGYGLQDVTHVLLTHIHLDHAGAAGRLAQEGAEIIVHPVGAPHMLNPEKLLASAGRIYGESMGPLWGEFLAVPEKRLRVVEDNEEIVIGPLRFRAVNTPGHAGHHYAYMFEDLCFTGDIGGIRLPGFQYLRLPMPPPELYLERWHESVERLKAEKPGRIAPTHFGIYEDAGWHLEAVEKAITATERWLQNAMSTEPVVEDLRPEYMAWMEAEGKANGLPEGVREAYEVVNPSWMSADGLKRYWFKVRQAH